MCSSDLGDMVTPGRPLVVMHDPSALRVTASVPQGLLGGVGDGKAVRYEIPGLTSEGPQVPAGVQLLPSVDPATHTAQLRLTLPVGTRGLVPGLFARVWLPAAANAEHAGRVLVPATSLVRQGEMTGVFVLDADNQPRLRQVRTGPRSGDQVELLSGVSAGERIVPDPQAARRFPVKVAGKP